MNRIPNLPFPDPIRGVDPGTWAHSTITLRLPDIAARVIAENQFPPAINSALEGLIDDLPFGAIRYLHDPGAPDTIRWDRYIQPYLGESWLEVPWFFAETYFYRRILEATGYFGQGLAGNYDPFRRQKRQGLLESASQLKDLIREIGGWLSDPESHFGCYRRLLQLVLWGNKADLSLWPTGGEPPLFVQEDDARQSRVLVDQSAETLEYISSLADRERKIGVVTDNAGLELMTDLLAAGFLLQSGAVSQVRFYLKSHPTFVSDATAIDFELAVRALEVNSDPDYRLWGDRIRTWTKDSRFSIVIDPFWTSPLRGWEMPADTEAQLGEMDLVVVKGDMNYRRLLGDLRWSLSTPFNSVVQYFPAPLLALRVLKAELATDMDPSRVASLNRLDPEWLTNGRWGVIQFSPSA